MSKTKDFLAEVEKMTESAMDTRILELEGEATEIDAQIRAAKAGQIETGVFANPSWFSKASNALKFKRFQIHTLQTARKKLKQASHQGQALTFERAFVVVAKRLLQDETYLMLCDEARAEAGA